MAGNAWKWVLGCGMGCVAVLIIIGALVAGGFFVVRDVVREVEKTQRGMDEVTERFGRVSDFHPAPDGTIASERIAVFLAVRQDLAEARTELERTMALLEKSEDPQPSDQRRGMLGKLRAGFGILPLVMGFYNARTEALLEQGMGLGEYYYVYCLAYYSWLGKSPADGPSFRLVGDSQEVRRWEEGSFPTPDDFDVRESRMERILSALNRQLLPMLRNQLADLEATAEGAQADAWAERLRSEIAAMETDPLRLPWAGGLPERTEESLLPFRTRLEESYSAPCNALEFGLGQD